MDPYAVIYLYGISVGNYAIRALSVVALPFFLRRIKAVDWKNKHINIRKFQRLHLVNKSKTNAKTQSKIMLSELRTELLIGQACVRVGKRGRQRQEAYQNFRGCIMRPHHVIIMISQSYFSYFSLYRNETEIKGGVSKHTLRILRLLFFAISSYLFTIDNFGVNFA